MGSNNKYFAKGNQGLGLDLYFHEEPFTATPQGAQPGWSVDSQKVGKYTKNGIIYNSIFKGAEYTNRIDENTEQPGKRTISEFVSSNINSNDDEHVNKTGLVDMIEYLQKWKSTWVNYADFAYLKYLGVYPTNRLMIARRFSNATQNNLYKINDTPMATLISWVPDNTDFFSVQFGEKWESLEEGNFSNILDDIGDEFGKLSPFDKGTAGKTLYKGLNIVPLPGLSEYLQYQMMEKLGLVDEKGFDPNNSPLANPNLIKEASHRTMTKRDRTGSGLTGTFTIKFTVEYEQKYINGVDPSLIYLDIIQKSLIFGTSNSTFVFNQTVNSNFADTIKGIVSGDYDQIQKALGEMMDALTTSIKEAAEKLLKEDASQNSTTTQDENAAKATARENTLNQIGTFLKDSLGHLLSKYRVKLIAIMQSLTGAPSGCWHCTIGNPKKPIFSSGDLICGQVTLTLGPILAYNDLPSSIKLEFSLTPARNLGAQEIFDRFNTGQARTYYLYKKSGIDQPFSANDGNKYAKWKSDLEANLKEDNPGPGGTVGSPTTTT